MVRIHYHYVPVDFMVLDMGEEEEDIPIILGRPFLNTINAIIYVGSGQVHFQFPREKEHCYFNGYTTYEQPKILTLGYSLQDLKGISPALCTHRIPTDPNSIPYREPWHRLNNMMREVVKKEVLKLLYVGTIYPVPYSEWVSPV